MITARPTPWTDILLLCGKCARKMKGGYGPGGEDSLRTALRGELKAAGLRRQVRIVEIRCIGLCPKKAVTALSASHPERLLTIPKGANTADALQELLPGGPQPSL